MSDNAIRSTTQEFLDVYDIVNDMVLLKDGTAAIILQVGTMNFSLLAEQEQDAVIFTYGSLLNSLNYPIQINIQSQTKDATKYLRLLDEQITKASSDRKATLIKQYRDFVAALIKERNVLQKRFYIIVPATPGEMGLISPSSVLPGKNAFDISSVEKSVLIEKATNILEPRRDHLTSQFNRLGLYVRQLSTQEIIQNFYINYNPEAVEGQEISSSENYTTPLVRASFGGKFMQLNNQSGNPVQDQAASVAQMPQGPSAEEILSGNPAPTAPASSLANLPAAEPTTTNTDLPITSNLAAQPVMESATPEVQQPIISPIVDSTLVSEPIVNPIVEPVIETVVEPFTQAIDPTAPVISAVPNQVSAEQMVPEQMAPINQPAIQPAQEINQNLDISLDSSLIDSSLSEPEVALPQTFVEQSPVTSSEQSAVEPTTEPIANPITEPAVEPALDSNLSSSLEPATDPTNSITPDNNLASDFAEEITPLQNKFEPELKPDQNQTI
jgi:hypothetical protein